MCTADSILFARKWNNPEYYVFDRPSDAQIKEWQDACEELNDTYNVGKYVPAYLYSCLTPNLAYKDWLEVCHSYHGAQRGYDENSFLLWRMNELLPPKGEFMGEVERYAFFRRQADTLGNCWNEGTQWDYNFIAVLNCQIAKVEGEIYGTRLRAELPSIRLVIEAEQHSYASFQKAVYETFEKTQMSPDGMNGSAATMEYASFEEEVAKQRIASIVPFYLAVTDSLSFHESKRHALISDSMLSDEYERFISSLDANDYGYPLYERKSALRAERKAWNKWIDTREIVSKSLSGARKEIWDNCTNNVKRSHLISLKNRYLGHGICSQSVLDSLIMDSCSDSVLFKH